MLQPICDLHCDTATQIALGADLNDPRLEVNLPAMRRGGVLLQVFAFYIPPSFPEGERFCTVATMIERFRRQIEPYADEIGIVTRSEEAEENARAGRISAVLAVENGNAIENELDNLERFYQLGVRLLTIVHAKSNEWVISSGDASPDFDGLTDFGCRVIHTLNDLGIIVDVSHAHDRTVERVLELSNKPIVASHSCVHAICPIGRNLRDELIAGIAAGGGVVGINFFPGFLDADYSRLAFDRGGDLFAELSRLERLAGTDTAEIDRLFHIFKSDYQRLIHNDGVGLERVAEHIDYVVTRFGDGAVALGSDFDGLPALPAGVHDCGAFADLFQLLIDRGYSQQRLQRIGWGNFLRVFGDCCG